MAIAKMENVTFVVPSEKIERNNFDLISSESFEPHDVKESIDESIIADISKVQADNPYRELYAEMMNFLKITEYIPPFDQNEITLDESLDINHLQKKFKLMNGGIKAFFDRKSDQLKKLSDYQNVLFHMKALVNLDIDLENLAVINRIKLIFGRVPIRNYDNLIESPLILSHKRIYDLQSFSSSTGNLYLLNGWMPSKVAKKFDQEIDENVLMIGEPAEKIAKQKKIEVPVKVENKGKWLKGFEFVTEMFGTPSYGEIDPTPFVAAFFTFMFGFMLGDIGHGAILFLFGYFMYRRGSKQFGTVMMSAASASIFFGFMYGSIFGFEWLPAIWLRPIIQINQLMIVGIYYGIGMISFGMILNIINGFRQGNWEKALFSPEGIAGLVFYWPAITAVSFYLFEGKVPYLTLVIILIIVSLVAMLFKRPLGQLVSGEKIKLGEGFWVETGFGMFDTLISFLSNAISYVRLAAFALTHEALFEAFWIMTLMVLPAKGGDIWAVIIFLMGQLVLVGLEGLVVFIQSLRLTYYEFFTKFFEAGGRIFRPFSFKEEKRV